MCRRVRGCVLVFLAILLFLAMIPSARATDEAEGMPPDSAADTGSPEGEPPSTPSDLRLDPTVLGEKRETYTSLTDLFEVELLTEASGLEREAAERAAAADREALSGALFGEARADDAEVPEEGLLLASHLFLERGEEALFATEEAAGLFSEELGWVLSGGVLLLLGAGSFLAASAWHKRSRKKKEG